MVREDLPVAVIGAGPVGLAAASELIERNIPAIVFEQAQHAGATVQEWKHVRLFTPWRFCIADAARRLLAPTGWVSPPDDDLPTGRELVEEYLLPLADHPALRDRVQYGARVVGLSRAGLDKLSSENRGASPFTIAWNTRDGERRRTLAGAVIDASGTWTNPSPMGVDGLPVRGEAQAENAIDYGVPDVAGEDRKLFAGKRVFVVGAGHSAINVILDLVRLKSDEPSTQITWALRKSNVTRLQGNAEKDELPARGELGSRAAKAVESGAVTLLAPFATLSLTSDNEGVAVEGYVSDQQTTMTFDRIVVATGFRPDYAISRELRVEIDNAVEAPPRLAPLIDPNLHSCGTVPPHGADVLSHPDPNFYIVGAKSYGRAPTFLMATGYEQVRSVVAEIAGDTRAAAEVRFNLPATGVCSSTEEATDECCSSADPGEAGEIPAIRLALGGCCQKAK